MQKEQRDREKIIPIEIYTDGSLKKTGNLTFGGWAFIAIKDGESFFESADNEFNTTNQRMELKAIKSALQYAASIRRPNEKVIIYSDSAYAINCYNQKWYLDWKANGWVTYSKKPVSNQDLWIDIIPFFDNVWYEFVKVEGHSGNYWNEKCDTLAQMFAKNLKTNWRGIDDYTKSRNL